MENSVFSQSKGTLVVKLVGAEICDSKVIRGKMKLFCKVRLGAGLLETMPDKKNNTKPVWNSTLDFSKANENLLRLEVYHQNIFSKPTFLGDCYLSLELLAFVAEVHGRCEIRRIESLIGYLDIQIKWIPSYEVHPSPILRVSFPISYNQFYSSLPDFANSGHFMTLYKSLCSMGDTTIAPYLPHYISLPDLNEGYDLKSILENFSKKLINRINELSDQGQDEPEDMDLQKNERCVVCLSKKRTGVFYKCGHNCCCTQCGAMFIGSRCPICRELVFDFVKVL